MHLLRIRKITLDFWPTLLYNIKAVFRISKTTQAIWCHCQVVRQRSAKPLFPGSNPGGTSKNKSTHFMGALVFGRSTARRGNLCVVRGYARILSFVRRLRRPAARESGHAAGHILCCGTKDAKTTRGKPLGFLQSEGKGCGLFSASAAPHSENPLKVALAPSGIFP